MPPLGFGLSLLISVISQGEVVTQFPENPQIFPVTINSEQANLFFLHGGFGSAVSNEFALDIFTSSFSQGEDVSAVVGAGTDAAFYVRISPQGSVNLSEGAAFGVNYIRMNLDGDTLGRSEAVLRIDSGGSVDSSDDVFTGLAYRSDGESLNVAEAVMAFKNALEPPVHPLNDKQNFLGPVLQNSPISGDQSTGAVVALDGSTAVIGALREEDTRGFPNSIGGSGFLKFDSERGSPPPIPIVTAPLWQEEMPPPPPTFFVIPPFDVSRLFMLEVGASCSIDDDVAVIGAPGSLLRRTSTIFREFPDFSFFGEVTISQTTYDIGSVSVLRRVANKWLKGEELRGSNISGEIVNRQISPSSPIVITPSERADTTLGDRFGSAVAVEGNLIAVGATMEDGPENNEVDSGAVYLFRFVDDSWIEEAYLKPSNSRSIEGEMGMHFGHSVAIEGGRVFVGAPGENNDGSSIPVPNSPGSGAVYVFEEIGGVWSETEYLKSSDPVTGDYFGYSISVNGGMLAVGSPGYDDTVNTVEIIDRGSVNVFRDTEMGFVQTNLIRPNVSDGEYNVTTVGEIFLPYHVVGDGFGASVDLSGSSLLVGAPGEDGGDSGIDGDSADNTKTNSGAAYLFEFDEGVWNQVSYLKSTHPVGQVGFGDSVAVDGGLMLVGVPLQDGFQGQPEIFQRYVPSEADLKMRQEFQDQGISEREADPSTILHADGLTNFMKYAFGIPLDRHFQNFGVAGSMGTLPQISLSEGENPGVPLLCFPKNLNNGLDYRVLVSSSLENDSFEQRESGLIAEEIDAVWSSIKVDLSQESISGDDRRAFGVVEVLLPLAEDE